MKSQNVTFSSLCCQNKIKVSLKTKLPWPHVQWNISIHHFFCSYWPEKTKCNGSDGGPSPSSHLLKTWVAQIKWGSSITAVQQRWIYYSEIWSDSNQRKGPAEAAAAHPVCLKAFLHRGLELVPHHWYCPATSGHVGVAFKADLKMKLLYEEHPAKRATDAIRHHR